MNNNQVTTELDCPTCGKKVRWNNDFPHRPFCSARCKQIDFGDWANEAHSIAGEPVVDPELLDEAAQKALTEVNYALSVTPGDSCSKLKCNAFQLPFLNLGTL